MKCHVAHCHVETKWWFGIKIQVSSSQAHVLVMFAHTWLVGEQTSHDNVKDRLLLLSLFLTYNANIIDIWIMGTSYNLCMRYDRQDAQHTPIFIEGRTNES